MAFEDELMTGEKLVVRTGVHWIAFCLRPIAALVFAVVIFALGAYLKFSLLYLLGVVFIALGLLFALIDWLYFRSSRYFLTTRRVASQKGFLSRSVREMQLAQVESVEVHQPLFARLLGYGFVHVQGSGGKIVECNWVPEPSRFKKSINKYLPVKAV